MCVWVCVGVEGGHVRMILYARVLACVDGGYVGMCACVCVFVCNLHSEI